MKNTLCIKKTVLFNDIENMNNILLLNDPLKIKNMGKKVKNFKYPLFIIFPINSGYLKYSIILY